MSHALKGKVALVAGATGVRAAALPLNLARPAPRCTARAERPASNHPR